MPDRNARTGLPFRHRDWKHGISGFKASGAKQDPRTSTADAAKEGGGGDGRQRSSRRSQLPGQLRRLNAVDEPLSIDPFLVAENPADFQEKLLIDVRQFVDRNFSRKVRPGPDIPPDRLLLRSPARLMISVFYSRYGRYKLRHTDTKDCSIETYVRHGGKHLLGKVQGLTPFEITKDQLCVLRDDNSVGLADNYKLELVFETTDITAWPPLRLADDPDLAVSNTREWRLKTSVTDVLEAKHMPAAVLLLTEVDESLTVYDLKLDMRWSTGFSQAAIEKYMQQRLLPSIVVPPEEGEDRPDDDEDAAESNLSGTTCGVDHEMAEYRPKAARSGSRTPHYNMNGIINGIGGVERINAFDDINSFDGAGGFDSDDQGTENELETTPGRSLRARGQTKQYNLKLLSDQAQGKARKPRKPRVAAENGKLGEVERVNYLFLEPLNLQLADFLCCRCGASCETMSQLRLHLQNHDDLELSFHVSKNGECTIRVSLKDSSREMHGPPAQGNTFQLGRPKEILNLEKIVDGDTSWITSRFGPENEADEEKPGTSRHRSVSKNIDARQNASGSHRKMLTSIGQDKRWHE